MKTVMQVVYLQGVTTSSLAAAQGPVSLTAALIRNVSVMVGCSCVSRSVVSIHSQLTSLSYLYRQPQYYSHFLPGPRDKRSQSASVIVV